MKKLVSLLLIGLVAAFAVIAASPAGAKKGHPKAHGAKAAAKRLAHGVVQSVGSDSVTIKAKKGNPFVIPVDAQTKIVVNGKAATLSDVKVGYIALARLTAAGGPAKVLRAHQAPAPGTIVAGKVESVGSDSITVTKGDGSMVTIGVTSDTKILVDGKAATLADVKAGYRALVRRTSADGPAAVIRAHEKSQGGHKLLVHGVVDSVGSDSITLKGHGAATLTVAVNASTLIRVAGQAGSLSDIKAGYRAIILRAAADGPALAIVAFPPKS
jgi:cell pole-organizing protein PopZ